MIEVWCDGRAVGMLRVNIPFPPKCNCYEFALRQRQHVGLTHSGYGTDPVVVTLEIGRAAASETLVQWIATVDRMGLELLREVHYEEPPWKKNRWFQEYQQPTNDHPAWIPEWMSKAAVVEVYTFVRRVVWSFILKPMLKEKVIQKGTK